MYLHCIRSLRFYESCWVFSHTNRHLLSTSVTCHGIVFLCLCIVYVRYNFRKMYLIYFVFDSVQQYILVYVRYMSLDVFPMYLHCIRSLRFFESCCFFLSHKQASLVYIRYMSWDGFPMFLHCIRSLHFLKDVSDFFFF